METIDKIITYLCDRTYWHKKANTRKIENKQDREAYSRSMIKAGEQITSLYNDLLYYKEKAELRQKTITKQRETIKDKDNEIRKLKDLIINLKDNLDELRGDRNV